jgi:2-polyprenyl-6-methoxyphenol hydroxylase-like FAD-dependent oxidoreductase
VQDRAIVIGAGLAGLAAARVLSRRYPTVTILDRDTLPSDSTPRRGVPQSSQPHILLVSGLRELSAMFPGLEQELTAAGGIRFDTGTGLCAFRFGRRWSGQPTGVELLSVTRPQLESVVRARVAALPGVTIRDQVAVSALAGGDGTVTGVVLDTGETLDAALVVDCSGRGSRSDRWLQALGVPAPEQVEVKIGVSYSTRTYRRAPGDLPGWQAAFTLPTPPGEKMSGLAIPVEGDRWLVSVGGWHLTEPPADVASFEACLRSLPDPIVSRLISKAEPLSDVVVSRFPSSRRRLFEKLERLPAGYVALGDAICSFNPIYGQGMTCAAREASALGRALDEHRTPDAALARAYYAAAADIIKIPWQFAVGGDFNFPETTGPRPRGTAVRNWYARQIAYAAQVDGEVNGTFSRVQHLLIPPSALFQPSFVARVIRQARKRHREPAPALT